MGYLERNKKHHETEQELLKLKKELNQLMAKNAPVFWIDAKRKEVATATRLRDESLKNLNKPD